MSKKNDAADRSDVQLIQRKVQDRSMTLLLIGIALIMPPIAGLSLIDGKIAGLPITLLYVFAVWIVLIAGAAVLAPILLDSDKTPPDPTA